MAIRTERKKAPKALGTEHRSPLKSWGGKELWKKSGNPREPQEKTSAKIKKIRGGINSEKKKMEKTVSLYKKQPLGREGAL